MNRIPLLVRIIIAILIGTGLGALSQAIGTDVPVRVAVTFNSIFGTFLSFSIPLIIIGFIAPGIGSLQRGAGKLLGISLGTAYSSSVIAGMVALACALLLYPALLSGQSLTQVENPEEALATSFFDLELEPVMGVTTALVLAFLLGLGMTALKSRRLYDLSTDFQSIIEKLLTYVIIPLLPFHILGVFANMTYAGQVQHILLVFGKVFVMVVALHWVYLLLQYSMAGAVGRTNPFKMLRRMLPAYFTALGTQSSAATIPVTLASAKKAGVHSKIANFSIPLSANIHLSGSMITITACTVAVMTMTNGLPSFAQVLPLILILGVMMVAAPGVPGGAIMTAVGMLQTILGFDETMITLMIALYLAQDSFGTAANVTGDAAIAKVTEAAAGKDLAAGGEPSESVRPGGEAEHQPEQDRNDSDEKEKAAAASVSA